MASKQISYSQATNPDTGYNPAPVSKAKAKENKKKRVKVNPIIPTLPPNQNHPTRRFTIIRSHHLTVNNRKPLLINT